MLPAGPHADQHLGSIWSSCLHTCSVVPTPSIGMGCPAGSLQTVVNGPAEAQQSPCAPGPRQAGVPLGEPGRGAHGHRAASKHQEHRLGTGEPGQLQEPGLPCTWRQSWALTALRSPALADTSAALTVCSCPVAKDLVQGLHQLCSCISQAPGRCSPGPCRVQLGFVAPAHCG